jgi:hypothetical protein
MDMNRLIKKVKKKIKRIVVSILAFRMVSNGYVGAEARKWVRKVFRTYVKNRKHTLGQKRWAVKHGFLPSQVDRLGINKENVHTTISCKDYAYLRPLNGVYSKWIKDIISVHTIFKPFRKDMPLCYYQISRRDGQPHIIPLFDMNAGNTIEDVLTFIKDKKILRLKSTSRRKTYSVAWADGHFYFAGNPMTEDELKEKLLSYKKNMVLTEEVTTRTEFAGSRVRLVIFNEQGDNPVIGDAYIKYKMPKKLHEALLEEREATANYTGDAADEDLQTLENIPFYQPIDCKTGRFGQVIGWQGEGEPVNPVNQKALPQGIDCWDSIVDTVERMCRFAPQLEFFGMDLIITKDGFKIKRMLNHPPYPYMIPFSQETSDYLKGKYAQKREAYRNTWTKICRGCKKIKLKVRATFCKAFFPKSLLPYLSIRWLSDLRKDFVTNKDTTLKEKLWAAKYGFLSYRLHQYGITKENRLQFISDFEYKWLRHINNKYRHWMEDKITVKYVCSEYNECFPEYYYHISLKNGNNKVVSMMDLPEGYTNTYEDIFRLVKEKRSLALKPDEGSHGDGFYKFTFDGEDYYLNHQKAEKQDVLNILQDVKNQYLITEYIDMHPEIKRIYAGAVNTIRMIVFKKDGTNPVIGNAYMRFGSKRTGAVDNMGAGGMFAKIDIDTGRFYDAKIIEANEIKPCLYHPDTNVKIEGYLPNWEKVKQDVLNVAKNIQQLEYFGFDLALTETGLKFPEINRFPDYPAIEKYSPATIDYLLYKLEQKKKKYGYDVKRGHKLFKLPKR